MILLSMVVMAGAGAPPPMHDVFQHVRPSSIRADVDALREAAASGEAFVVEAFPLASGEVRLELEPFRVLAPDARIVLATDEGEVEAPFDPGSILFLRGRATGLDGSHVFLALTDDAGSGRVELGPGLGSYDLAGRAPAGEAGVVDLAVSASRALGGIARGCDLDGARRAPIAHRDPDKQPLAGPPAPARGLRQAEIAIEGDDELFSLFENEGDAIAYMVQVYGASSDIMMRDLDVRLDIIFLRLWTTPDDPWGDQAGWPAIPPDVEGDVAQLLSGTRDVGAGGGAFLCGSLSWVGFALGAFDDPSFPNVRNQDIIIAAHELGHNFGSLHTHDMGVDECDDPNTPTQRGSIISYCYYFSGGYANTDMRYHVAEQAAIEDCLANKPFYVFDCNQNGVDDAIDIARGDSADANANAIPDECEDCNDNGILDPDDILLGNSADLNMNGIPDECEPDCNGNGVPDDLDIESGFSLDAHGNGIPDECEADCNANGISDYSEIQFDMTLDVDRNAVLDACQDCDGDGIPDIVELDGANSLWAVSSEDGVVREYHAVTGVLMRSGDAGHLADPQDVLITGDGRILVTSAGDDDHVVEFDRTGAYVTTLIESGAGGLDDPGAMLADGDRLLVASGGSNSVLHFDLETGAFVDVLIEPDEIGPVGPYGLAIGPTGHLLVGTADHRILEYDALTGALIGELVAPGEGGLDAPRDLLVLPDGRLLVASESADAILAFDGASGEALGQFNYGSFDVGLEGAWGLTLGHDGYVYATGSDQHELFHLTDPRMLMYDPETGWLIRTNVQRPDSQLEHPRGVAMMVSDGDCNLNLVPDACDIASGASDDVNANGIPDECEDLCYADFNDDDVLNVLDFVVFQLAWQDGDESADCDANGSLEILDFLCFQQAFVAACP